MSSVPLETSAFSSLVIALLNSLVATVNNEEFWKSKMHFSTKQAPDGIQAMRAKLKEISSQNIGDAQKYDAILNCIAGIGQAKLGSAKGFSQLLFGGVHLTRDKCTTDFYKLCAQFNCTKE